MASTNFQRRWERLSTCVDGPPAAQGMGTPASRGALPTPSALGRLGRQGVVWPYRVVPAHLRPRRRTRENLVARAVPSATFLVAAARAAAMVATAILVAVVAPFGSRPALALGHPERMLSGGLAPQLAKRRPAVALREETRPRHRFSS